jgi:hypothetical protein
MKRLILGLVGGTVLLFAVVAVRAQQKVDYPFDTETDAVGRWIANFHETTVARLERLEQHANAASGPSATSAVGRFIIVNGTPEQAANIMLLDTATGTTWVICSEGADVKSRVVHWCGPVPRGL